MSTSDTVTVGLSQSANAKLDELYEREIFSEKMDGYRFAVGLALAHGIVPPEIAKRETFLNVGSLDPDQSLKKAIEALMPAELESTTPYRLIERLADWGVNELYSQATSGDIDFVAIFDALGAKSS